VCRETRSFKPYPDEHDSVKQNRARCKNCVTTERKPSKCPTKEKQNRERKAKEAGRRESKK